MLTVSDGDGRRRHVAVAVGTMPSIDADESVLGSEATRSGLVRTDKVNAFYSGTRLNKSHRRKSIAKK